MKINEHTYGILVKIIFVIALLIVWEGVARAQLFGGQSDLIFPTLGAIANAFVQNFVKGYGGLSLGVYIVNSMNLLFKGLLIGILLSCLLSGLSMVSKGVCHIYNLLVSIFDLLPGVALLPVIIVFFGVKPEVIVALVVHAVLWPLSRSILDGFQAVPSIYIESGLNIGLTKFKLLYGVYIPASMTYILSGIKAGWARAWRGLISAEMIFGIASCPGIGLYINQMRTSMNNVEMYATLLVIIIIGVMVQYGILIPIENNTVKKWGMTR